MPILGKTRREVLTEFRRAELVAAARKVFREIRAVPVDAAAFAICDLTRSMATQRVLGWEHGDLRDAVNSIFDLVWKGLAARGQ